MSQECHIDNKENDITFTSSKKGVRIPYTHTDGTQYQFTLYKNSIAVHKGPEGKMVNQGAIRVSDIQNKPLFLKQLGAIMDQVIGSERCKIPQLASKAHDLLFQKGKIQETTSKNIQNISHSIDHLKERDTVSLTHLASGGMRLTYSHNGDKTDFLIYGDGRIVVKKFVYIEAIGRKGWYSYGNFFVGTQDQETFFSDIGKLFDQWVGSDRFRIPKTANRVYKGLFGDTSSDILPPSDHEQIDKGNHIQKISDTRSILFYKHGDKTWDIQVENKGGNAYVTITQGGNTYVSDIYVKAPNDRVFIKKLGRIMNIFIGHNRTSVPQLGRQIYNQVGLTSHNEIQVTSSLRVKPIDLGFKQVSPEKTLKLIIYPRLTSQERILGDAEPHERVVRVLRWKGITDAVEDRYDIPRGLLMAMMAQEGLGDPTIPNVKLSKTNQYGERVITKSDGGLGPIHIQAVNAANFGLDTLPRFTKGMKDYEHGKKIIHRLNTTTNLTELIESDDRWHPVMSIDASARFLLDSGNARRLRVSQKQGINKWKTALRGYSGRPHHQYGAKVFAYWKLISEVTGDNIDLQLPTKNKKYVSLTRQALKSMQISIDGIVGGSKQYYQYFEDQNKNYGLDEYKELGKYQ